MTPSDGIGIAKTKPRLAFLIPYTGPWPRRCRLFSINSGLQVGDRVGRRRGGCAAASSFFFFFFFFNDAEVGVNGRTSAVARQPGQHSGCLWWLIVVEHRVDHLAGRNLALDGVEKRMNSRWRWRCIQRPMTVPSSTLSAANSAVLPCRLYSCVMFWQRPGLYPGNAPPRRSSA